MKLKRQNKKLEKKYLPKPDSNISRLASLMAEVEIMQFKRTNAQNSLLSKYAVDLEEDTNYLDETILPLYKDLMLVPMIPMQIKLE